MRTNVIILAISSIVGISFGLLVGRSAVTNNQPPPPGSSFESLEHLRSSILERDERDVKADKSVSLRSMISPHLSDEIIYDLQPNLDVRFQHVGVQTNSCGMRSPERRIGKPAGTFRIALLGDSFAFGWGVEQDKIFAQVLEDTLNEITAGEPRVEVLNFGVPGYSTFQEVAQFEEIGLDFDPDLVLVYFVDNDFGPPFYVGNLQQPGKIVASQAYNKQFRRAYKPGTNPKIRELAELLNANRALVRLSRVCRERGIPLAMTINPRKNVQADVKQLWFLKENKYVHYFPLRKRFVEEVKKRRLSRKELTLPKDVHPSAVRHQLLGELLAEGVLPFVYTWTG